MAISRLLGWRAAPALCRQLSSVAAAGSHPAAKPAPSLEGQFCWVAGGVGIVGAGICRGLLRAGATVIVNSRHESRLEQLSEELGHPERLICVKGSMLPTEAEKTIDTGLELTGSQLNHVVAHCAVRWWARDHGDESTTVLRNASSLLALSPAEFPGLASQLASLHFAAAHHLLPRLAPGGASYTFVTGGGRAQMRQPAGTRSSLGHINAAVVWGLAGALRSEMEDSAVRVSELRVEMRLNRPASERKLDPRETPLSHQIGSVCAGFACDAKGGGSGGNELYPVTNDGEMAALRQRYPAADMGYSVYFRL